MIKIRENGAVTSYSTEYYALCGSKLIRVCDGKIIKDEVCI